MGFYWVVGVAHFSIIKKLYDYNNGGKALQINSDYMPIFLDEHANKLYCKDIVVDINSFKIIGSLPESVYAFAPGGKRIVGINSMYRTSDLSVSSNLPETSVTNIFFDNSGKVYSCEYDYNRVFYYREEPEVCELSTIEGDSSITVPANGTLEVQYKAVGKDQFDIEIPNTSVIWSVYNSDTRATDLSISDTGVLNIENNTAPGNYTISAVAKSNENVKSTIQIVIKPSIHEVETVGDFNGDKAVNSIDFAVFRKYLLGIVDSFEVKDEMYVGDLNRDGKINSIDFAILRGYLLGKFDELPYVN